MDEPRLPDKKIKGDDNGVQMLLAVEFISLGYIGYWSSKDTTVGKWCILDGLCCQVTFERK